MIWQLSFILDYCIFINLNIYNPNESNAIWASISNLQFPLFCLLMVGLSNLATPPSNFIWYSNRWWSSYNLCSIHNTTRGRCLHILAKRQLILTTLLPLLYNWLLNHCTRDPCYHCLLKLLCCYTVKPLYWTSNLGLYTITLSINLLNKTVILFSHSIRLIT